MLTVFLCFPILLIFLQQGFRIAYCTPCDSSPHLLLAWHVLCIAVVPGPHVLVDTAWSNLHVCSQLSKIATALRYSVVTPLDPEISTLSPLFKPCLQCSFRCFLHTALSCYPYICTPNFHLCILTDIFYILLNTILDMFETRVATFSFLIPSI